MGEDLPFSEEWISGNQSIRTFNSDTDDEELKWHFDMEDRIIEPLHENDWQFQFDNLLPQNLNSKLLIKSGEWHRLIKGSGELKIRITRIHNN
jgi:hypothetical protein